MKTSIVPAEITTLEDSITAKLSLTQVIILVVPIILTVLIFCLTPPLFKFAYWKIIIVVGAGLPIISLALKIKSKLIFYWLLLLAKYYLRPKNYFLTIPSTKGCDCGSVDSINQIKVVSIDEKKSTDSKMSLSAYLALTDTQQGAITNRISI